MRGRLAIAGALGAGLATFAATVVVAVVALLGVPGWALALCALAAGILGGLFGVVAAPVLLGFNLDGGASDQDRAAPVAGALNDLIAGRYSEVRLPGDDEAPGVADALRQLADKLAEDRRGAVGRETELREKLSNEEALRRETEQELAMEQAAAQAAPGAQDVFLARMSHELRTPLNAVLGYSEMLLEEAEDAQTRDDLSRIRSATLNLLAMVTSVLDLTQLHSGDYAILPEPVDLATIVRQVVDATRLDAESQRNTVNVQLEEGVSAILDRRMLHSILFNLVSNAVKYTNDGTVDVRAARSGDLNIHLQVVDSGIGMTERQIQEAFEPFRQGDGTFTRRYDGSGLGLAVVRGFAEAMGGTVTITSKMGQGATVTVELPMECEGREPRGLFDEDEPTMLLR